MRDQSRNGPEATIGAFSLRRFSSVSRLSEENREGWHVLYAGMAAPNPASAMKAGTAAEFASWKLGDAILSRTLCSSMPILPWPQEAGPLEGYWCVMLGRTVAAPLAGSVPHPAFRHRRRSFTGAGADTEVVALHLPPEFPGDKQENFRRAHHLEVNPHFASLLGRHLEDLARLLPMIPTEQASALLPPTRALVAACLAFLPAGQEAAGQSPALALIDRARLIVRQNMASPDFGPEQLRRLLAMSRSKLYRLFESSGGAAHFINRERLREAHRRLNAHEETLSIHVIGHEVGFTDHSTFSRAFRREFGHSPTEIRGRSMGRHAIRNIVLTGGAGPELHEPHADLAVRPAG